MPNRTFYNYVRFLYSFRIEVNIDWDDHDDPDVTWSASSDSDNEYQQII